jgi:hypothetical protein
MSSTTVQTGEKEVSILAGILGNGHKQLTREVAGYILELGFTDAEKARMHDLAVRNQKDALSPDEKEELHAFGKAGDILAILKSKARRTLGVKVKKRTIS